MGQQSKERRAKPTEAVAKVRTLRTGFRKLNVVAQSSSDRVTPKMLVSWMFGSGFFATGGEE